MRNSSRVKAANLKPFKKGDDPRRSKNGAMCSERAAFKTRFWNHFSKKLPPEELADILIAEVRRKRPWAVQEALDRLIGKEEQPVSGQMTLRFKFGANGNGNNGD